jgi:hypothetical protein
VVYCISFDRNATQKKLVRISDVSQYDLGKYQSDKSQCTAAVAKLRPADRNWIFSNREVSPPITVWRPDRLSLNAMKHAILDQIISIKKMIGQIV